jgi:hypothetical protein
MVYRILSYASYENEPLFIVALAFLFYGAMTWGVV